MSGYGVEIARIRIIPLRKDANVLKHYSLGLTCLHFQLWNPYFILKTESGEHLSNIPLNVHYEIRVAEMSEMSKIYNPKWTGES